MTLVKTRGMSSGNSDVKEAGLLSKTALNRLNQQAAELGQYVIAFKDLTSELPEDTGIQCGMIILNVKGKYVYVPVIAKNGEVQMLESMFDSDSKEFIPLTRKSVRYLIDKGYALGEGSRIPAHVARDPNLYDAVVPPKTGKFVYASEGRIGGFFATLPNHIKEATLRIIDEDYDLQEAIVQVMDIDVAKAHLIEPTPEYVAPSKAPAPQVITSAEGLNQEQIQEIMAKGYTVLNPPKSKKVAVEATTSPYGSLTYASALNPGMAAMALKSDGSWVGVAAIKHVPSHTSEAIKKNLVNQEAGSSRVEDHSSTGFLALTEDGHVLTNPRIVICATEVSYSDVIDRLPYKKATMVSKGDFGMIFTGAGWIGPICVDMVDSANNWTTISCREGSLHTISIHPNIKTPYDAQGGKVFLSDAAVFYPVKSEMDITMERDINMAQMKVSVEMEKVLPYQSTLVHRNGTYAVDGRDIGGKPQIVEHMLNEWEIDVPTVETFVKSAEEKGKILVKMAAVRDGGRPSGSSTKVQAHYEQGDKPMADPQMTGNARQRAEGMASKVKATKELKDRQVMEATLISEMLQNPDLEGSIQEYLPDIRQAVDKLGRSLFLMRLNTNKLNDSIDAEALNNLFTATRNAYRILGENCVQLENLASNELS